MTPVQGEPQASSFQGPDASTIGALEDEERRQDMAPGIRLLRLEAAIHWARHDALWPLTFGLACCSVEMLAPERAHHDLARFGDEVFMAGPREADLMILSGRLNGRMAHYVRGLLERMAAPRRVIGIGDCLRESAIHHGIGVDRHVEGCPPRPRDLFEAIETLFREDERPGWKMIEERPWGVANNWMREEQT